MEGIDSLDGRGSGAEESGPYGKVESGRDEGTGTSLGNAVAAIAGVGVSQEATEREIAAAGGALPLRPSWPAPPLPPAPRGAVS